MGKLIKLERKLTPLKSKKRVAAYARISMETERLHHSLSAQVSFYAELIQSNPEWEYAGVYSDEGISGTSMKHRTGFIQMMADADAGKIDIILCKSISRFGRNTVDILKAVRHLKEIGIDVRFEKEGISSMSADGELMLTLLASFAQAESESLSANVRWSRRKRFEQGLPHAHYHIYGYIWHGDTLVVVPEEAKIVRLCYENYLLGISPEKTERFLAQEGITNTYGRHFTGEMIRLILINIFYTGNMLFQRFYSDEDIDHKLHRNKGEVPQYFVENTHEAIIPMEVFKQVQDEIRRREEEGFAAIPGTKTSCFTSRLVCRKCGHSYVRTSRSDGPGGDRYYVWRCSTKNRKGAGKCNARRIREEKLKGLCAEALGIDAFNEDAFTEQINNVIIDDNTLEFHFKDGRTITKEWEPTGNKDSWTAERRKQQGKNIQRQWKEGIRHGKPKRKSNTSDKSQVLVNTTS